ncbi:hypothetical protein M9H77_23529 [Catharanthus roseus]|uniref:Uncharacterized protein n=1 Tax=Catharanthus roseus TaxID=4058 RepID=A0ACC0AUA3_CATRO|nr:hypothetical protein M9H77_23529 [Catharanthus roseus]
MNRLDMQEHQGVVTRAKAKQLKSHKDYIEQEKFQGLNFDVQDFMGSKSFKVDHQNSFILMSTQAQATTHFGAESSNSQHDDPLRLTMQELQSLRDKMRDIRRDVTNLSNKKREVSPHGSLNVTTPRSNGPFNCSRTTKFHQPPF